jgi:SAM-dependent methyltransferase
VLGHPFVYNRIRPLVVGGVDMTEVYASLEAGPDDVIVDVGCGTGDALNYLTAFAGYHGFDVDATAVDFARSRWAEREDVSFETRALVEGDLNAIRPSLAILAGLLHHLDDEGARGLLEMLSRARSLRRIVTQDPVFIPGERLSNLLAHLDRGKFVRNQDGYLRLAKDGGLEVESARVVRSSESGWARYLVMALALPVS